MRNIGMAVVLLATVCACNRAKQGAKDALNTGGEIAGKAAGEVVEGMTTGVQETWRVDVRLSDALERRGLGLGKTSVQSGAENNDNLLVVYLTNTAAVDDTLRVVAYDKDSLEMGRALLPVKAAANSGTYYDVQFPTRTDLERKCRVVIEQRP